MNIPGGRLHRVLANWIDELTMREVVEPTLADLQHEVSQAGDHRPRRWLASWLGYGGLARALLLRGVEAGAPVRRAVAIVAIGIAGGVLCRTARLSAHDPRVVDSALLLPVAAGALALRLTGGVKSYRRIFVGLICLGGLMWVVGGGFARATPAAPWLSHVIVAIVNLAIVVGLSAVAATAVWTPVSATTPTVRRVVVGLLSSAATTTVVYFLGMWLSGGAERSWLITSPFYVLMFAVPLVLTSVPLLFVAARWIPTPVGRIGLAVLISPLAMLVILWLEIGGTGGLSAVVMCLRDAPMQSALMTIPFTVGNAVLVRSLP